MRLNVVTWISLAVCACGSESLDTAAHLNVAVAEAPQLATKAPMRWWVLVHPNDGTGTPVPGRAGIYEWTEGEQTAVKRFALPDSVNSPHGLVDDGRNLWLSHLALAPSVLALNRTTGAVEHEAVGVALESLTLSNGELWAVPPATFDEQTGTLVSLPIKHFDGAGGVLATVDSGELGVQGLASNGSSFYVMINDEFDRIVEVNPATGARRQVASHIVNSQAPSVLAFDGASLVTVDWLTDNFMVRIDPVSGATVSRTPLPVVGWVTAMAPVKTP